MRIYVAGGSSEANGIALYMRALRLAGLEVTHDWTVPVLAAQQLDRDISHEARRQHAYADMLGVASAEILWLIVPKKPTIGAWCELGMAIVATPRPYIIVSGDHRQCLFASLADETFDRHDEAYDVIWSGARETRLARTA